MTGFKPPIALQTEPPPLPENTFFTFCKYGAILWLFILYFLLLPFSPDLPPLIFQSIFLKNGPIPASFCLVSSFSCYNVNYTNWKSIHGVLGIRTRGRNMVGADKTTELWWIYSQLAVYTIRNLWLKCIIFIVRKISSRTGWNW